MNNSNTFFGHPIGLKTLFLTEMWERMSYYGMRALLVLFMTGAVSDVNPGLGWSSVEAQAIYGIYVGLVYFMVVPGGWIADNIIGHQKAVLYGAIIIAIGHYSLALMGLPDFTLFLPAFDFSTFSFSIENISFSINEQMAFFGGLLLVVLGTGLLKGNISTIVGKLYDKFGDEKRDSGYTIFYMSINIGSTLGFLVCSFLGEKVGWHWGFGAAGIGMTFGVIQYISSKHLLGDAGQDPNPLTSKEHGKIFNYRSFILGLGIGALIFTVLAGFLGFISFDAYYFAKQFAYFLTIIAGIYFLYLFLFAGLNSKEKKNLALLFVLFIGAAAFWSGFDQSASSLSIFARDYTDLSIMGYAIPVGWLQFFNPIFVVIFAPIFAGIWGHLALRNLDPSLPIKFAIGLLFMGLSFIVMLFAVKLAISSAPVGMQWLILTYLFQTWGELALSPIGLSAFSRYSPKKYVGQMFGLWFLASAIGGVLAGLLGGEALGEGLDSISPVFNFMIKYYLVIAVILIVLSFVIKAKPRES